MLPASAASLAERSGPPIYHQIARTLESRIYHGLYRPGEAIPSESELSREFGVTRLTVRQALQRLNAQQLLIPRRGSGTYVAEHARVLRPVNFLGYLDDQAFQPLTLDISLGRIEEMPAPEDARQKLVLRRHDTVLFIERIRSLHGVPANRAINYLPVKVGRRLPVEELTRSSMTELVREYAGLGALSATQTLSAEGAPPEVAERLRLEPGAPVLRSDFVVQAGATPCNYSVVHYRPEHTFFTATLISVPTLAGRAAPTRVAPRAPRRQPV
jgi:GntR family transcriptional regulator